jgi:hypothetical protein
LKLGAGVGKSGIAFGEQHFQSGDLLVPAGGGERVVRHGQCIADNIRSGQQNPR